MEQSNYRRRVGPLSSMADAALHQHSSAAPWARVSSEQRLNDLPINVSGTRATFDPTPRRPATPVASATPMSHPNSMQRTTPIHWNGDRYLGSNDSPVQIVPQIDRMSYALPSPIQNRLYPAMSNTGVIGERAPKDSDWTDTEIRLRATFIRDNHCEPENVLRSQIQDVHRRVLGRPEERLRFVNHGLVEALASCLRAAPATLYSAIVQTLAEVVTDLKYYPVNINDTLFSKLASLLIEHAECLMSTLQILGELTKFEHGQNSAHNTNVPNALGLIISKAHQAEIVRPALFILSNIAKNASFARALVEANVYTAFIGALEKQLLNEFQRHTLNDSRDSHAASLLWTMAMSENRLARERLVRQVTFDSFLYCNRALEDWKDDMTLWSHVMQFCVQNNLVWSQVKGDFIQNSFIILRYGRLECANSLIRSLCMSNSHFSDNDRVQIINANIVEVILERHPVNAIWSALNKHADELLVDRSRVMVDSVILDVLALITNLLRSLPRVRDPTIHTNNVIATLTSHQIVLLASVHCVVEPIRSTLMALFGAIDNLTAGWTRPTL